MTIDPSSLEPGEQLLWCGTPDVKSYCRTRTPASFRAGLAFLAAAVLFATYEYFQQDVGNDARTIIVGLFMIAAFCFYLPVRVRHTARRTAYAITDRRAIIEAPDIIARNRVSVPFSEIQRVEVRGRTIGDILFRDYVGQSENGPDVTRDGFFAIANVESVERLFRSAIEKAAGNPPSSATK